jgi:Acetyltransferase (GNAT) domain
MLRVEHYDDIPDDLQTDEIIDAQFHRAFKAAEIPGLIYGYYVVLRNEVRIGVIPYFIIDFYPSLTMPNGLPKKLLSWFHFRLACVDHPATPTGTIYGDTSLEVLDAVNKELEKRARLLVYKGFPEDFPLKDFIRVKGHPVANLTSTGDFWSKVSSENKRNLRRKLRMADALIFRQMSGKELLTTQLLPEIFNLYLNVERRSDLKFIQMNQSYFEKTAEISKYLLAFKDDQLVGFVQIGEKKPNMAIWLVGLDYEANQKYGVYFLLAIKATQLGVAEGYKSIELGLTSYQFKKRLGCDLLETYMYYRHRNSVIHWLIRVFSSALEPTPEQLK